MSNLIYQHYVNQLQKTHIIPYRTDVSSPENRQDNSSTHRRRFRSQDSPHCVGTAHHGNWGSGFLPSHPSIPPPISTYPIICLFSQICNTAHTQYSLCYGGGIVISFEPLFQTMREKGITSYRLFKMGFPQSNYYAMKRGENVSTHTVNELCRLLECNVSDIMTYVEEKD